MSRFSLKVPVMNHYLTMHNQKPALTGGPTIVNPNWQEKAESVPAQSFLQCLVKALLSYDLIRM